MDNIDDNSPHTSEQSSITNSVEKLDNGDQETLWVSYFIII